MTRWETLARRVVIATAVATAALVALAMGLSYAGLRAFYLGAGFPTVAASLFPLPIDLLFPVGFVAALVLAGRSRKAYAAAVVALAGLASAGAQGYHQSHGGVTAQITDARVLFVAGASAMLAALVAGHLLWLILERALPADFIAAMKATTERSTEWKSPSASSPASVSAGPPSTTSPPRPVSTGAAASIDATDGFPELEKLLVDYDNDLAQRANGRAPVATKPRVHRPTAKAPSQQPRACYGADCGCDGKVQTRSTWYRHNPQGGA